jgi:arylsulfatase A-like enzyme
VAAELEDGWMWNTGRSSTSHSTTALQNRRVPILFRVPGLAPARPSRVIRTVDIAPTLAALLGILPTESLDGVPLPEVLGSRPMR